VLGGLEALRILKRASFQPSRPISVVAFMDEEGSRFGTALFGSRAFVGEDLSALAARTDAAGISLSEAMSAHGYSIENLSTAHGVSDVAAYLELHIEQGPVLEDEGVDIGIVTSIVGLLGLSARFSGEANHAGTTPMNRRRDALVGAARAIHELRDMARGAVGMTANVGTISVEPGGKNVVPGVCTFSIDVRAATPDEFATLDEAVRAMLIRITQDEGLELAVTELYRLDPVIMDAGLVDTLEQSADSMGASHLRLPSGAGHDAMALGRHVPSGMIFVPSRAGVSHSPAEHTSSTHCDLGAAVLARALEHLG
jgi:hydantoinase/carbamoylase family amidase